MSDARAELVVVVKAMRSAFAVQAETRRSGAPVYATLHFDFT